MIIDRIKFLLELCSGENAKFPPTDLYNEGWMLRLVLDWLDQNKDSGHKLCLPYPEDARWYSEALLPSAFLARQRGDKLAESWTHADGVIGDFSIGSNGKGDLTLNPKARCFLVVEAKMFSKLSPGVTNASYYNQAARNVACMAEVTRPTKIRPSEFGGLGFYVMAPRLRIDEGVFKKFTTHQSIREIVKRRVDEYEGKKQDWYDNCFLPTLDAIEIRSISWEEVIESISNTDSAFGGELNQFYQNCLKFNRLDQNSQR